ncbi:MAG: hypothetical protein HY586_01630 [Candidatus Omnitrophica bacterium]|nr:hypothetical protein [Candidatus Omnitrophota bacterium]
MANQAWKGTWFIALVFILSMAGSLLVWRSLIVTPESFMISLIWVVGFGFLFFNVLYIFSLALSSLFIRCRPLKEIFVRKFPKTALVYPICNETHGLFERMSYSMAGNRIPGLDLWILSDSGPEQEAFELSIHRRLSDQYPGRVFYRRRPKPVERKQGNLKEFLDSHPEYTYLYVADADSMVPEGVILKLLRKAEHPDNKDIAIFQCFCRIAHAGTWYAHFERIGSEFSQRLNFSSIQTLFGRSISFGHHQLVRAGLLGSLEVPKGVLSHDNWDTALLDEQGYRVAFCSDVVAYDEAPSHYLEARARAYRWARGTLQGWPIVFRKKLSVAVRFLTFYGIYLYLADIVFFLWVILGLLIHSVYAVYILNIEIDSIWYDLYTNSFLNGILFFSFGVAFLNKLLILRSFRDFFRYIYEVLFSTFLLLNNFLYSPLNILSIAFRRPIWKPMSKNPFASVGLWDCVKGLWPGTLLGFGILYFCLEKTPFYVWQITPLLVSLILSIPVVYWTARRMPHFGSSHVVSVVNS